MEPFVFLNASNFTNELMNDNFNKKKFNKILWFIYFSSKMKLLDAKVWIITYKNISLYRILFVKFVSKFEQNFSKDINTIYWSLKILTWFFK